MQFRVISLGIAYWMLAIVMPGEMTFFSTDFAFAQSRTRTYTIVPSESSFRVFVGKTGLFSALAHNHDIGVKSFNGRVVVPEAGTGAGSLEMEVDATSLEVLDTEP